MFLLDWLCLLVCLWLLRCVFVLIVNSVVYFDITLTCCEILLWFRLVFVVFVVFVCVFCVWTVCYIVWWFMFACVAFNLLTYLNWLFGVALFVLLDCWFDVVMNLLVLVVLVVFVFSDVAFWFWLLVCYYVFNSVDCFIVLIFVFIVDLVSLAVCLSFVYCCLLI